MARADQISQLQNDLHINHFHEIGADALAEKLYDAGYRLIPELTLLTDKEIEKIVVTESRKRDYTGVGSEDYVKAGSQAQLDKDKGKLSNWKYTLVPIPEFPSVLASIGIAGLLDSFEVEIDEQVITDRVNRWETHRGSIRPASVKELLAYLSSYGFVDSHGLDVLIKQGKENLAKSEKALIEKKRL